MPKSQKQRERERTKRRAAIRRGMKIAIYEIQQALAPHGAKLTFSPAFIPYTVAIAEGGRRGASPEDRVEALQWQIFHDRSAMMQKHIASFLEAAVGHRRSAQWQRK